MNLQILKRHFFFSSKKDKGKLGATFKEPTYTVQDQVPSSLGTYGDISTYGVNDGCMSRYDALRGPSVSPPEGTESEMSDHEEFDSNDKSKIGATHLMFKEPLYTVQDQVFYPSSDRTYGIVPVTSSHPQSSSLGTYGDMSMYGGITGGMSRYDALHGPSVSPPERIYNEMSDHEEFDSDDY